MSNTVCLHCGEYKFGALIPCEKCGGKPLDVELSCMLTDHILEKSELEKLSTAIKILNENINSKELRFLTIYFFISKTWPHLIEFNSEQIDNKLMLQLNNNYNKYLKNINVKENTYDEINQKADNKFRNEILKLIKEGKTIFNKIESLNNELVKNSILNRINNSIRSFFLFDNLYKKQANSISKEINDYSIKVYNLSRSNNNFSQINNSQNDFLNGTYLILHEMIDCIKKKVYFENDPDKYNSQKERFDKLKKAYLILEETLSDLIITKENNLINNISYYSFIKKLINDFREIKDNNINDIFQDKQFKDITDDSRIKNMEEKIPKLSEEKYKYFSFTSASGFYNEINFDILKNSIANIRLQIFFYSERQAQNNLFKFKELVEEISNINFDKNSLKDDPYFIYYNAYDFFGVTDNNLFIGLRREDLSISIAFTDMLTVIE